MCVFCTDENDRFKYLKECLKSLVDTVDLNKHYFHIINNKSSKEATEYLIEFVRNNNAFIHNMKENLGTAMGINLAIKERFQNQVVIKTDEDLVWHQSGWVEELEEVFQTNPEIGVCGLKRIDVYGDFTENGKLLMSDDIIGTCFAMNPKLLDAIGYLVQPSSKYGFEDSALCVRSLVSGFKNCFLPHIGIDHIDNGGTPYTDWKKKEAGLYLNEVSNLINMYKTGQLNPYYDGGDDI